MSDIKKLARLIKKLKNQVGVCTRCGMCQAFCPLFAQTGREADVARGKLALLDGLMEEMFKDPKGVFERLNRCLLCGSCEANCPRGVNILEIFMKARTIIGSYIGLSPVEKLILRGILSCPERFDHIAEWTCRKQDLLAKPMERLSNISCSSFVSTLPASRHFKQLAPVPFHRMVPALNSSPGSSGIKAAFFVGCLIDKVYPHIAQAAIDVLHHHGVGVFMPGEQGCCGIPSVSSGDMLSFKKLVCHNLEKFESVDFEYLVTACATCTFTIKKIWPMMFQSDSPKIKERIQTIATKTLDISQFLSANIGLKTKEIKKEDKVVSVTYHDPCHLKKSLGVFAEPRELIKASPRYRLKEMPEADWCCGMGGIFNLRHYDISTEIGKRKIENIKSTGCSIVASGCPACMIQISDMLSNSGDHITVKHTIELYAESIRE